MTSTFGIRCLGMVWRLVMPLFLWSTSIGTSTAGTPSSSCLAKCLDAKCVAKHGGRDLGTFFGSPAPCAALKISAGPVRVSYPHRSLPFTAVVASDEAVARLLRDSPPDACGYADLACQQAKMAGLRTDPGGHGIDGRIANPAGTGAPCEVGLPCGLLMPPSGRWTWILTSRDISGEVVVQPIRSTSIASNERLTGRLEAGTVTFDASAISSAGTFAYSVTGSDGKAFASGEFTVVSMSRANSMRQAVDRAVSQGQPEDEAWVEVLTKGNMTWDLFQRLQAWGRRP